MKVYPDKHEEYQKRHREIWPEMIEALHKHKARNYSIFLDEGTSTLFGYVEIEDEVTWNMLAASDINQRWWAYMESVMETNSDKSPVTEDLKEVFHMA